MTILTTLDGIDAVVTGASSGHGLAFAEVLADAGARVWMVADAADELHEAVSRIVARGGKVEFRVVDLTDPASVAELVIDIRSKTPRLEVLVNGASDDLDAVTTLSRGLLPGLRRAGGSVVNVSTDPRIEGFTRDLAAETIGAAISVNSVARGLSTEEPMELAENLRFLCTLRGQLSGRHLEMTEVTRQRTDGGLDTLFSRLDDEADA